MSWLEVASPAALVLAALALVALAAGWGSRRWPSGRRGWAVRALRAGWLLIALLLALGLRWPVAGDTRPWMAALYAGGQDELPASWQGPFRWRWLRLGGTSPGGGGRPPLAGPRDLGAALAELAASVAPPDGIVLLGDADPAGVEDSATPLYLLARRDDALPGPPLFLDLRLPDSVVPGLAFRVHALLRCRGASGTLRLVGPGGDEDSVPVSCPPGADRNVELHSAPTSRGLWGYQVTWHARGGEGEPKLLVAFPVDCGAPPLSGPFVEEFPGWEASFLRRTARASPALDAYALTRLSTEHVLRGPEIPQGGTADFGLRDLPPARFQVLVLRAAALTDADAEWLRGFVQRRGGGLVLLGPAPDGLESLAPLPRGDAAAPAVMELRLTEQGRRHPILRGVVDDLEALTPLQPELDAPARLPPSSRVLIRAGARPLLALRRTGAGTVVQLAAPETYRWRLQGGDAARAYGSFWLETLTWLARSAGPERRVTAAAAAAAPGTRVPLSVEWRDGEFRPSTAPARLEATSGSLLLPTPFRPGHFSGWTRATAGVPDQPVPRIATTSPEQGRLRLEGLASASGGRILYPHDGPPEVATNRARPSSVDWLRARESLWPPVLLLALAAAEWGARRRWGCEG